MEQLITQSRAYFEALHFLSGIIVAIAALFALRQIRLMKRDIMAKSERAAKEKAIEAAFKYAELGKIFMQCLTTLEETLRESYKGPIGDFTPSSIPEELKKRAEERRASGVFKHPLNTLDVIAANFISRVADEEIAFPIFGRGFCLTVDAHYDVIAMSRKYPAHAPFSNTVQLYKIWLRRLSRTELEQVKQDADEQLKKIPENFTANTIS
jgi:hypothetical protein